ncbi:MAG TPA: VWA-like domain-containing protein [Marmoricola sp.]|nr:VWA-like domain-containing protein [Marmoricola sp.]HNJ78479.1 VWA-like domain-containing protein [Marmoricola sp.]
MDLNKLAAAKLWLISPTPNKAGPDAPRDLPYLAQALYALIPVPSEEVSKMTCDEQWRIYLNPTWLAGASVPRVGAELAHMVWHLLGEHATRARAMDVDHQSAAHWKQATDVTINDTLTQADLDTGELPSAAGIQMHPGQSAEIYYAHLSRLPAASGDSPGTLDPDEGCGSGADGIPRRHEHGPNQDIGGVSRFEASEIRRRVAIDYRDHLMARGEEPGEAMRWIKQILQPRVAWEPLLSGAVRRAIGWAAGRGDYTYTRPSRRRLPGVVLPGQQRPVPRVSVLVDTSASMDDELLTRALSEVDGALQALGASDRFVHVYSVDAAVHTVQKVRRAQDAVLVGAGGTDLRIGFRAIELERPRPEVVIVFTDGYTPWPATPPPTAAVIIGLIGREQDVFPPTPEWATRVECVAS